MDVARGQMLVELKPQDENNPINSAKFSPDGKFIVTASNKVAELWEVSSGNRVGEICRDPEDEIEGAEFSPDGKLVVTFGQSIARVWEVSTKRNLAGLRGHTDQIKAASFSPDSKFIVTASGYFAASGSGDPYKNDNEVRVWDVSSGVTLLELLGSNIPVSDGMFSLDGRRILTANWDATAQIYECNICVSFDDLLKLALQHNVRQMTADERVKYMHESPGK